MCRVLLSWIKQSHKQSSCTVSFKLQMNTTLTQAQQPQIARLAWCIRSTQPTESSPVGLGIPEPPTEPLPLQEWDILVEENTCSIQELQAPPTFYTRMRLFLNLLRYGRAVGEKRCPEGRGNPSSLGREVCRLCGPHAPGAPAATVPCLTLQPHSSRETRRVVC